MLAKVQALARQSAGGDKEFVKRFEARVGSLARNQDILIARDWSDVPVEELVRQQLVFADDCPGRFLIAGEDCSLSPRASEVIGMALHELATNSMKYGALSVEAGSVAIAWHCPSDGHFDISWRESGGPPVAEPPHTGFGTSIIRDVPRAALGAEVELSYRPDGMHWRLSGSKLVADPLGLDALGGSCG